MIQLNPIKIYESSCYKLSIANNNIFLLIKGLNSEFCIEPERACGGYDGLVLALHNSLKERFEEFNKNTALVVNTVVTGKDE